MQARDTQQCDARVKTLNVSTSASYLLACLPFGIVRASDTRQTPGSILPLCPSSVSSEQGLLNEGQMDANRADRALGWKLRVIYS